MNAPAKAKSYRPKRRTGHPLDPLQARGQVVGGLQMLWTGLVSMVQQATFATAFAGLGLGAILRLSQVSVIGGWCFIALGVMALAARLGLLADIVFKAWVARAKQTQTRYRIANSEARGDANAEELSDESNEEGVERRDLVRAKR